MDEKDQPESTQAETAQAESAEAESTQAEKDQEKVLGGVLKRVTPPMVLAGVAAIVIVAVALFVALSGRGPSDDSIKQAISEKLDGAWPQPGPYDAEGTWEVASIDVVSKEEKTTEAVMRNLVGDTYYDVTAKVKAGNGSVDAEREMKLYFVKAGDSWQLVQAPSTESVTYSALSGPDEAKIAQNASEVLRMLDAEKYMGEHQTLYAKSEPQVSDVTFDESNQTAGAKLTFVHDDAFSSAKAEVTASFTFKDGSWQLEGAAAEQGSADVSHEKLVGTWKGTFKDTRGSKAKCFGAQGKELTIKITSLDEASKKVEGTFQGTAHYHEYLHSDANGSEGDTDTGEIPFVATLKENDVIGKFLWGKLMIMDMSASFTAPETADGVVAISFGFGTKDDPNAAVAKLFTRQGEDRGIFISNEFEDTYTLTKAE